jgi:glycosyltransferase involved in cell wall biosynthesis
MTRPLRVGLIGPVATRIPARKQGSVELVTSLLCDGLVDRGHDVTLFSVAKTQTRAKLHAIFDEGYWDDPHGMWPWEMCELYNVAAAFERHTEFDVIHYQGAYFPMSAAFSRLCPVPVVQTIHHQPVPGERMLFQKYPETHYVTLSRFHERAMSGLPHVHTVMHGLDTHNFALGEAPEDILVFLGRFTAGKGALAAIDIARRTHTRLLMAAPDTEYYRSHVAPHVDGDLVQYLGELDFAAKTALLRRARALLYPVQEGEPFGLVLVEAMASGTPVAALRCGAVPEIVEDGVSGYAFESTEELIAGLPRVYALDRINVRAHAVARFDARRMVDDYERLYERLVRT